MFNVVHGDKEAVDAILAHPAIKAVSFVGSTPIAQYIYETGARNGKRVQALGGAKNHAVVMPDADLDFADRGDHRRRRTARPASAAWRSRWSSRSAMPATRCVDKLAERARARRRSDRATRPESDMGPVITCAARDRIVGLIDRGVDEGATLVVDGRKPTVPGHEDGFFVGPTLFDQRHAGR